MLVIKLVNNVGYKVGQYNNKVGQYQLLVLKLRNNVGFKVG